MVVLDEPLGKLYVCESGHWWEQRGGETLRAMEA